MTARERKSERQGYEFGRAHDTLPEGLRLLPRRVYRAWVRGWDRAVLERERARQTAGEKPW